MNFEIIDEITVIETIVRGTGVRDIDRLHRNYGQGNWRKMKGVAHIRLGNGRACLAELHRYELHGIGKKEIKRKRYLE